MGADMARLLNGCGHPLAINIISVSKEDTDMFLWQSDHNRVLPRIDECLVSPLAQQVKL